MDEKSNPAQGGERPSRRDTANIISRLTLYWTSSLISTAYKRRLEMHDVDQVPKDMRAADLGSKLEASWTGSFFSSLWKIFKGEFLFIVPWFLVLSATSTTIPFLVQMFLRNLSMTPENMTGLNGWVIVVLMLVVGVVQSFAINTGFLNSSALAVKIRSAIAHMVFRKAVKLSSASRASLSAGDVLNLMSQDTERIFFAVMLGHTMWWGILMMIVVAIVLLAEIGIAGLAAVILALLIMPITSKIAAWIGTEKRNMLKSTDERVSLSSEMLQGIQTVKMQNWEQFIKDKVFGLRKMEMRHGRKVLYLLSLNSWQVFIVPPLMAATCFAVLAGTAPDRLNVATIYAVLAFLNTLQLPLDLIPRASGTFAQALVSIRRIERFMALKDVDFPSPTSSNAKNGGGGAPGEATSFDLSTQQPSTNGETRKSSSPRVPMFWKKSPRAGGEQGLKTAAVVSAADSQSSPDSSVAENKDSPNDLVLSMRNCTLFWTRKKEDENDTPEQRKKNKKLAKSKSSIMYRMRKFRSSGAPSAAASSSKYARQTSFAFATSFRTGPVLQPVADEDETVNPNAVKIPRVEMEEVDVLRKVNLDIKKGELIVIVGEVGSGKTSLLAGVLGEIGVRPDGEVKWWTGTLPSVAYVPQEPWIQNDSLRNNVLFIKRRAINEEIYSKVITAVQMEPDLKTLPKGDNTEIGSRGINLSGGQKARVGLARAVYHALVSHAQQAGDPVVACDDPFSALDPNVATAVWSEVIQGLLNGFTRVVCLNSNLNLASKADRLVVLQEGSIVAVGEPAQILNDPKFAWLFDARDAADKSKDSAENEDEDDDEEEENQEAGLEGDGNANGEQTIIPAALAIPSPGRQVSNSSQTNKKSIMPTTSDAQQQQPSPTNEQQLPPPDAGAQGKLYKAEERADGGVSIHTYWKWLRSGSFLNSPWLSWFMILGLYAFTQGLKVFADLWLGSWSRGSSASDKGLGLGVYFGAVGLMIVFSLVRALVFTTIAARASLRLHDDLVSNILRAPVNLFFDVTPVGRVLNRMSNDMDNIDTRLPEVALQLLHAMFQILGAIVMAAYASPFILLILLPLGFIFSELAKRLSRCQRELKRFDGMSRSPLFSHFGETLSGLTTVRSFQVAEDFKKENARLIDFNCRFYFMFWMTARWLAVRVDLLAVLCQFSICALALGTKTPNQDTAVVGLAVTYSLLLTTTVQACTRYVVETENAMVACERIIDLIENVPQERSDGDDDFVITKGEVVFENVSARYRPHLDLCVRNVSFSVKGGQKVGLCGRSGSAKSTMGNILFGMLSVEPGGRLLFDGRDSTTISLRCLRSQMSVIPQTPVIFSGSIRFAIDPWGHCESDAELWAVLKAVEMDGFVRSFPGQLDGRLDENAASLSVGERQLLCVARALLRKSRIVLLDESTASVDAHSDVVVQRAVEEGFQGATIFVIAHRLHTIVQSDVIAVMEQGRLKEFGPPAELLQRPNGMFKQMWDLENHTKAGSDHI